MDRVIKFRSWNEEEKVFYYFFKGLVFDCPIKIKEYNHVGGNKFYKFNWDNAEQFTRRIDKNGKDIYEGDIINLLADSISEKLGRAYGTWRTECVFINDSFQLRCIDKKHLVWRFTDLDFNGKTFIREIIGNIHEKTN